MTRGQFYSAAMPIWAILYVMGLVTFHNHTFTVVGALVFALIAVVGSAVFRPDSNVARDRRERRAARRGRIL